MKTEIKEKFLKVLELDSIKQIRESEEFYFQKAVDKYNEFMGIPRLENEAAEKLLNRIIELRDSNSFSNLGLLKEFDENSLEYKLLYKIAELVAYIDSHGFNKKEFNKYEDTRTIASAYVRQHVWVINLIKYKQSEKVEDLPGAIKNAIRYLIDPEKVINVLSEKHRKLIGMFIFQNSNIALNFDEVAGKEMAELNVIVRNEKNRLLVYERIIYSENIKKIWDYNQTIWKVSHGNIEAFKDEKRDLYLNTKIVAVHKDTKKNQGNNFVNTMKVGDLFYLCYGGREIKLLGIITSEAVTLIGDNIEDGWMMRSYDVIKESVNKNKYTGVDKGWSPNHNSTCVAVKENQLTVFEKELLTPYFDMTLEELLSDNITRSIEPKLNITTTTVAEPSEGYTADANNDETKIFEDLNYILYGPPGTGKTYNTVNYAVAMIENKEVETLQVEDYKNVKNRFESLKKSGQIMFTTFHQSYGYEEFIEGIKPKLDGNEIDDISYYVAVGIFKGICEKAIQNKTKNYVVIIDEINRGNISKIFGELITLIEKSKRLGAKEETKTTLPYSKKEFGVPSNLFILGTMNTADRSIALLDTALRRRFEFIEMMPDTDIFKKLNNNAELIVEDINIKYMLDTINNRIEILYDREHTIGQAYLIDLIEDNSIENLSSIFIHKIIPLLQEYFYEDYEKIRLVLGDNQVKDEELQFINVGNIPKNLFGRGFETDILEDKKVYKVNKDAFTNPSAYLKIYNSNAGDMENE
jgi:hypothetical protein